MTRFMKPLLLAAMCVAFALPAQLTGQSIEKVIKLSDALNDSELSMQDYSEYLLKKARKDHPDKAELIDIQLANTYFTWGKKKFPLGEKILKKFGPSSKYYDKARITLGIALTKKKEYDKAIKIFSGYLNKQKSNPPKDELGIHDFKTAVMYLSFIYKKKNMGEKAAAVLKDLTLVSKGDDKKPGGDRRLQLQQLKIRLDTAEQRQKEELENPKLGEKFTSSRKKKKYQSADWMHKVNGTLKGFDDLRWAGPDEITCFSYVEKARAFFLLGRYEDALKELNTYPELFQKVDDAFDQAGISAQAPGADARFLMGRIYQAQAKAAKDAKVKEGLLVKAFLKYFVVLKKYQGFARSDDAYYGMLACKDKLKKEFGKSKFPKINYTPKRGSNLIKGEVARALKDERYKDAVPMLLKIAKAKRRSAGADELLGKLAFSLAKTDQALEAVAVSDYLGRSFPDSQSAPWDILKVGELYWKANKKGDAIDAYSRYIDYYPDHKFAGPILMRIAQDYYKQAVALAKQVNKATGDKKKLLKEKAVEAFAAAVPFYKRLADNYEHTTYGAQAYYMLALCYASTEHFDKSAETYLKFIAKQQDKEQPDYTKMAECKLRAADSYFKGGQLLRKKADELREKAYQEAARNDSKPADDDPVMVEAAKLDKKAEAFYAQSINQLTELTAKWFKKGSKYASINNKKILKAKASGFELLGWAYDAAGKKEMAVKAFRGFIDRFGRSKRVPACMMRMGVIYTELNDDNNAEKILGRLVREFPKSQQGKNAAFFLGKSLFNNKKYAKSIRELEKVFKQNPKVQNLRWIAENLSSCDPDNRKAGAQVALKAAEALLKQADKPVLADWLGEKKARDLQGNKAQSDKIMKILKQRLLFQAGRAAFESQLYQKSVEFLSTLLEDKNTPYFYDALFQRADSYMKMKNYKLARGDYSDISMAAMTAGKDGTYTKSQCMAGETYLKEGGFDNIKKAFGIFKIIAAPVTQASVAAQSDAVKKKEVSKAEKEMEKEWLETAVYKAAFCASKLGDKKEASTFEKVYKKLYPYGKFKKEIRNLPKAENK